MMDIDWSKAPEGATHYGQKSDDFNAHWFKVELALTGWLMWHDSRWISVGKLKKERFDTLVSRPAPWTGEGLPPVGTVCEIHHTCWGLDDWQQTDIKYISSDYLIVGGGAFKSEQHFHMSDMSFRPTRTAEQIAAAEREVACRQLCIDAGSSDYTDRHMEVAYKLYDAGYRKQEQK